MLRGSLFSWTINKELRCVFEDIDRCYQQERGDYAIIKSDYTIKRERVALKQIVAVISTQIGLL